MKKGISTFVAAVLLIGFTVAVGAILSVWFTTFTKTQTATVQAGAACHAGVASVFSNVTSSPTSAVRVFVSNKRDDMNLTITSVIVSCGAAYSTAAEPLPLIVGEGSTNYTDVRGLSGCTISNTEIRVTGSCSTGGFFEAGCVVGTCGF